MPGRRARRRLPRAWKPAHDLSLPAASAMSLLARSDRRALADLLARTALVGDR